MKKKVLSFILALVFAISCVPMGTFSSFAANEYSEPTIYVESKYAAPGETINVDLKLVNNPGVAGAKITVTYDPKLILTDSTSGETFSTLDYTKPGTYSSPCNFNWDSESAVVSEDGTLLTLTFQISEDAVANEELGIGVSYRFGDIYNEKLDSLNFDMVSSSINVINYIPGDVNGDKVVNGKDVTLIRRYNAGGYDVEINVMAADVNDDGIVNGKDVTLVRRDNAGGYDDVKLKPSSPSWWCVHNGITSIAAKSATCEKEGNIAYWHCEDCGRYFSNEELTSEISFEQTVLAAVGHQVVIDPAVSATYDSTGLTEGSHCEVCKKVIVEQEIVAKLEKDEYPIAYDVYNGDSYLQSVGVSNDNQSDYSTEEGLTLKNISAKGYKFLGWYDLPAGTNAQIVKSIPAGTKGEIELYAHWEKEVYDIEYEFPTQFNAGLVSVSDDTYTVDKGKVLPTPELDGYIFAGWSDDEGNVIKKVPVGSTGPKQYTANWLSKRNQAWTKNQLDDPIILEDTDSNTILFTYEIGEIRNVPVDVVEDFGYINSSGVSKTVSKKYATEVDESLIETYENTVSNATVNSYGWTLSNDWSDSTSIDQQWYEEHNMTQEEAEEYCKSDTGGWYVSSGSSGSSTTETLDNTDTYDLKTSTQNASVGGEHSSSDTHAAEKKVSHEANVEAEYEYNVGIHRVKVGGSYTYDNEKTDTDTSTTSDSANYSLSGGNSDQGGSVTHTGTNTTSNSGWNSESGYNGSSTVSNNTSLSKAISESVSENYGYGKTYITSGGESTNQGLSSTNSSSDSYGSSVTYSTKKSEEVEVSYTTSNTVSGYHRWIMADTAHVFAIVGYDIATASYFVTTYTVMEDNLKPYEDYSCSSSKYDDNQNSFISFEVPYEVTEYVANRVGESEGLEVNSSGVITGYSGTDEYVVVPEYKVIHNQDGTNSVIRITGISENAFRGNTRITGIMLSTFIREIPAYAFMNCTSLTEIQGCITTIGQEAFSGCTSMKAVDLGWGLESIGENAFDSVESITLYAINEEVISAVTNLGVKNITVYVTAACDTIEDITFAVADTTETFTFNGYGKTFTDVYIVSDAAKTIINRATFVSSGKAPLQLSSTEVDLQEATINAPAIGLICSADNTSIMFYGESYINSNGTNAILSKNISFGQIKTDFFSRLNITGNALVCGEVENGDYLAIQSGEIITIDEATFELYKNGVATASFDLNGGSGTTVPKKVYYGQTYGDLPTVTKANYTFAGWYTQADGGTAVTADTTVSSLVNHTLYAHWTPNKFKLTYNANGGKVSTSSKTLTFGNSYGSLPTPTRDYYTFKGWFTAASGGTQVSANTKPSKAENVTIYAHWEQKPVSGWVLSSAVPSGAQTVKTKYSYTLTSYTTSSSSSLSGWTKYKTTSAWSEYGSWSGWSTNAVSNSDSRQIETKTVTDREAYTIYRYGVWRTPNGYGRGTQNFDCGSYGKCTVYDCIELTYELSYTGSNGLYGYYDSGMFSHSYDNTWFFESSSNVPAVTHTEYRYRDRHLVYTYYYSKQESKESSSYPSGNNISNIQTWVQYRAK